METYFTILPRHRPVCGAGRHGTLSNSFAALSCERPGKAAGTVRVGGWQVGFLSEMEPGGECDLERIRGKRKSKDSSRSINLPLCLSALRACFPFKPGRDDMWDSCASEWDPGKFRTLTVLAPHFLICRNGAR